MREEGAEPVFGDVEHFERLRIELFRRKCKQMPQRDLGLRRRARFIGGRIAPRRYPVRVLQKTKKRRASRPAVFFTPWKTLSRQNFAAHPSIGLTFLSY